MLLKSIDVGMYEVLVELLAFRRGSNTLQANGPNPGLAEHLVEFTTFRKQQSTA